LIFKFLISIFLFINLFANESLPINTTWNIQLQGDVNKNYPVQMYEIDLFDVSTNLIQELKDKDIKVICYFNGGAWESYRSDTKDFPKSVLGKIMHNYPNEKWLDIRSELIKPIMEKRLDLAVQKGCDGVDPDNMNGYINDTGFKLTYNDQLRYNKYMAKEAKKRGLLVALKNDLAQIPDLVDDFDFVVNEECFEYNECEKLLPFIEKNKAVFNIEYKHSYIVNDYYRAQICKKAKQMNFSTLFLDLKLDDSLYITCP